MAVISTERESQDREHQNTKPQPTKQAETPTTTQPSGSKVAGGLSLSCANKDDRLVIGQAGQPLAEFVFRDPRVLRPYFSNVHAPGGIQVTRNHPPLAGTDATDHDTMHPGIWLGMGDVSGVDFWRNKGRIEHTRFIEQPEIKDGQLTYSTQSQMLAADGSVLGQMNSRFVIKPIQAAWLFVWDAAFVASGDTLRFGDQEEMGFGARVATALTETNGGRLTSSTGKSSAKETWGQTARWCDYSGETENTPCGVTLMAGPKNVRESWWHNRDYGVFVANPFGRAAMKQGDTSSIVVPKGESMRLVFGAAAHAGAEYKASDAYQAFLEFAK